MYKFFFKRLLDFTASLVGFIMLSPVFLIVMIGLFFANNGKPFFFQIRPGKNERLFKIIKFKTMNDKKGADGQLLSDAERLTSMGKFVRRTSLDEIPQLLNVLKGDMSLIGPRPLLPKYLPFYTVLEKRRHEVRPGITGLAQIKGRNTVGWDERLAYDIEYINNMSFYQDVSIIMYSVKVVLLSEGVSVDSSLLMKDLDEERKH